MSWATCYSGSNNIHFDNPPMMSDGRFLSNWDPSADANRTLKENVGITTNYEYRQYLMKNSDRLINANIKQFVNDSSAQFKPQNIVTKTKKYLYKSLSDSSMPHGYESSDLKNMYLSRQALNSRLKSPIITQEHMLLFKASQ